MGRSGLEYDYPPSRTIAPVSVEEYESRAERYDEQLCDLIGVPLEGLATEEKMAKLRAYKMD